MKATDKTNQKSERSGRLILSVILTGLLASGCAQYMAIKQPAPYQPSCLNPGAKRIEVIAEMGQPVTSESQTYRLIEAYKYVDGGNKNSGGSKTGRVILYTAGDLFTLWLDQIIWMPTEYYGFAGTDHSVIIEYTNSPAGFWQAATVENKELKSSRTNYATGDTSKETRNEKNRQGAQNSSKK